jgi:anti-anti-sigma factor
LEVLVDQRPDGVTTLKPVGRVDLLSAAQLRQEIEAQVAGGRSRLVIDLSQVPFIDSSGLGALVGGLKAARVAGGDLRVAQPGDQARLVMQLTTLDRVLRLYDTVEEAADAIS